MSRILDRLQEAEAQRQRVVAERKRLEAEADAALAARDLEEQTGKARIQVPVPRADPGAREASETAAPLAVERRAAVDAEAARPHRRAWAGAAAGVAVVLAAGLWSGIFSSEKEPVRETTEEPAARPETEPVQSNPPFRLKLDRDVEAFAARVKPRERR